MASASVHSRASISTSLRTPPLAPRFPLVNPPASQLGLRNAVYSGSGTRHDTGQVPGWLSIKTMITGSAVWETAERRFTVDENSYLILNDHHRYALRFESGARVTTFALFFQSGLAEDVFRCQTIGIERLLDEPADTDAPSGFFERLETRASPLFGLVQKFKKRVAGGLDADAADDWFVRMASQMVREQQSARRGVARLPGVRASTRAELFRRVLRGRDFLLSQAGEEATLGDAARAACLSPFHFHRAFTHAFGETPHQALTRYRMERAAALLSAGARVTDVCLAAGFESLGSFSSLFRRHFGMSPRDYRAAQNK
jgi:AraC family transcriptional regulator